MFLKRSEKKVGIHTPNQSMGDAFRDTSNGTDKTITTESVRFVHLLLPEQSKDENTLNLLKFAILIDSPGYFM